MQVRRLTIKNFRGIKSGEINFQGHAILVGGNNIGKSTICEALDLVLGPERLFRRPIIDEHDFHKGEYLSEEEDGKSVEIVIRVLLVDLSEEAKRRFFYHLRLWNEREKRFVDDGGGCPESANQEGVGSALPLVFIGRYEREEDDFVGSTFFDHPPPREESADEDMAEHRLGGGRKFFGREHKRLCGFIFLRALRTGSRALSLQRGSLLDTILRFGGTDLTEMWEQAISELRGLDPAIGSIDQLKSIRQGIHQRLAQFVNLPPEEEEATGFYASDLTRNHLREVVRLFIAAEPAPHQLPFYKLGTGSINLLVFALLTLITKDKQSVIFAMEEPEIALPPHAQRRIIRFVLSEMGQAIVTSHSPYIIERFEPDQIMVLDRTRDAVLSSCAVEMEGIRLKHYRRERRQIAEAILSRAVIVVEGATEAALFPAVSAVLEKSSATYEHFDLAGITVFDAGGGDAVAKFGPFFKTLKKPAFAFYDKKANRSDDDSAKLARYMYKKESPYEGIESLLVKEVPIAAIHRFLAFVKDRSDYPNEVGTVDSDMNDESVKRLAQKILKARKGDNHLYAAYLIEHCSGADELPATIRDFLKTILGLINFM